jgi:putative transposase
MREMALYYQTEREIGWEWQSIDRKSCPAPLGGEETGRNPADRGKQGSKIHLLVDEHGAPLALRVTGANEHDKWSADDLLVSIAVERPDPEQVEQHLCADKGHDYEGVHQTVAEEHCIPHIKHRRRRNEPVVEECPMPGELRYPARRRVVERTLSWLSKRRGLKVRWCKKVENWIALNQLAFAPILLEQAICGQILTYLPRERGGRPGRLVFLSTERLRSSVSLDRKLNFRDVMRRVCVGLTVRIEVQIDLPSRTGAVIAVVLDPGEYGSLRQR